jgi:hypothetical protein
MGVQIALTVLTVALWCYGLNRFVHYDHFKGVRSVDSVSNSGRAVAVPGSQIAPPLSRQGDSSIELSPSKVAWLTGTIRECLAKAAKTEDLKEIRSILAEIRQSVDTHVVSAKVAAAAAHPEYEEPLSA